MIKTFRVLSIIEGSSLLALFFVAMPLNYKFGYSQLLWNTGMAHGILWLIYFILSLAVSHRQKWAVTFWMVVLVASVIPFACFFLDKKLKKTSSGTSA